MVAPPESNDNLRKEQALKKNIVVLVTRDGLGNVGPQNHRFGQEMFDNFIHALESRQERPSAFCFYTDGVKLVAEGSLVVPGLKLHEGMGARVVSCGTCLKRFGLTDRVAVGEIGTMADIATLLTEADSVLRV